MSETHTKKNENSITVVSSKDSISRQESVELNEIKIHKNEKRNLIHNEKETYEEIEILTEESQTPVSPFNIDLNLDISKELMKNIEEKKRIENSKNIFTTKVKKFLSESFKLLIYGYKESETPKVEPAGAEKNLWNLYGLLKHRTIWNCFGALKEKNFTNCFGLIKKKKESKKKGLGMILGVIIPVVLNIFGVILFLRLPMGVGNGGILVAIIIFCIGYCVTGLTVSSICAISTNGVLKGGGAYFMISRILGPELGGGIGFIFFLANVAGGALYIIGFMDSFISVFPEVGFYVFGDEYWSKVLTCTLVLAVLTLICLLGADFFSQTGLFIFIFLFVSLVSTIVTFAFLKLPQFEPLGYTGWNWNTFITNLLPYSEVQPSISSIFNQVVSNCSTVVNNTVTFVESACNVTVSPVLSFGTYYFDMETNERLNFQKLFSILFPACTGAMAGANLSGDLKEPGKSIPFGTIFALVVTFLVYIFLIIMFGSTVERTALLENYSIVSEVSFLPILISLGIFAATISSGLTSIIGGSRVLSAISKDNLLPFTGWFAVDIGWPKEEPRISVLFTALLIQCLIFLSKIGFIAPFVTQFFLVAYGMVNLACFALSIARPPNFRPHFKYYSWWSCLLGVVLCLFLMFFIDYIYASFTLLSCIVIIVIIYFFAKPKNWGDIISSMAFYFGKKFQNRINNKFEEHIKYWRLKILVLVSHPKSHFPLIRLFDNMSSAKGGLGVIGYVKTGHFREGISEYMKDKSAFYDLIKEAKLQMFFEITFARKVRKGIQNLLLHAGFSGMNPDICAIGFFDLNRLERNKEEMNRFKRIKLSNENRLERSGSDVSGKKMKKKKKKKNVLMNIKSIENQYHGKRINSLYDFTVVKKQNMKINDYIDILVDILLFKKGLIICRNFESIDRSFMKPSRFVNKVSNVLLNKKEFLIDIWILRPEKRDLKFENINKDSTSLIFQLTNLLLTTSIWNKYHRLRVNCIVDKLTKEKETTNQLKEMLDLMRIKAEIKIISLEEVLESISKKERRRKEIAKLKSIPSDEDIESLMEQERRSFELDRKQYNIKELKKENFEEKKKKKKIKRLTNKVKRSKTFDNLKSFKSVSLAFHEKEKNEISITVGNLEVTFPRNIRLKIDNNVLSKVEEMEVLNRIIKEHTTEKTSLIFITLPSPSEQLLENKREYYNILSALTRELKPTFLVYSKVNVISTNL